MASMGYSGSPQEPGYLIAPEQIEHFLEKYAYLRETQSKYRYCLQRFYLALPEEKRVEHGTVEWWRDRLLADGYAPRSVNANLSVVNTYLEFVGHREYQATGYVQVPQEADPRPELTRDEYLRLLDTARALKKERLYLQIKTIVCTGVTVSDLLDLTAEMVRQRQIVCGAGQMSQMVRLPGCLQGELLAYIRQKSIQSGLVFVTRSGGAMNRSNVFRAMQRLCKEAQVAEEKGTPSSMRRLYQSTLSGVENNISLLIERAMEKIAEQEQPQIGWQETQPRLSR